MSRQIAILAATWMLGLCCGCQTGGSGWGMSAPSTNWFSGWKNPWTTGANSSAVALSQGKTPSSSMTPTAPQSAITKTTPGSSSIPPNPAGNIASSWSPGSGYPATGAAAVNPPAVGQNPYAVQPTSPYDAQPAGYQQQAQGYQTGPYNTNAAQPQAQPGYGGYEAQPASPGYGAQPQGQGYPVNNYPTNGGYGNPAPSYQPAPANNGYQGGGYGGGYPADPNSGAAAPAAAPAPSRYGTNDANPSQYPVRPVAAEQPLAAESPAAVNPPPAMVVGEVPPTEATSNPSAPSLLSGRGTLPANLNSEGSYRPGSTSGRVWR